MSASRSRRSPRTSSQISRSYSLAAGSKPYGPLASWACPWSALAMNATLSPDAAAAAAIATPAWMWSAAERSRAGVTTTSGVGGCSRPPMNHSGISTPQSIGATASAGSLEPKLTPLADTSAEASDSSTRHASVSSVGTSSAMAGGAPESRPATRPATRTPIAPGMWTLCGVATTTACGRAVAKSRPSSSMPARVAAATSRSSAVHASAIASPPCGAIAAKTSAMARLSPPRSPGGPATL